MWECACRVLEGKEASVGGAGEQDSGGQSGQAVGRTLEVIVKTRF